MIIVWILLGIGIVGVLGFALTKPDTFRVERSLAVKAPANAVYPLVADFHRWTAWSPYENRDPAMKRAFGSLGQLRERWPRGTPREQSAAT